MCQAQTLDPVQDLSATVEVSDPGEQSNYRGACTAARSVNPEKVPVCIPGKLYIFW